MPSRRTFLSALSAGTIATLAGCSSNNDTGRKTDTMTAAPVPDDEPTPTPTPTATLTETNDDNRVEQLEDSTVTHTITLTGPLSETDTGTVNTHFSETRLVINNKHHTNLKFNIVGETTTVKRTMIGTLQPDETSAYTVVSPDAYSLSVSSDTFDTRYYYSNITPRHAPSLVFITLTSH